jgi:hypothetical protein
MFRGWHGPHDSSVLPAFGQRGLETTDSGKLAYTNEAARSAALQIKLEENAEHRQLMSNKQCLEVDLTLQLAKLERLSAEWRLYLLICEEQIIASASWWLKSPLYAG